MCPQSKPVSVGFPIELEFRSVGFYRGRSKDEYQQQTQPTYDAGSGNHTWATLVGGERSLHCVIPSPLTAKRDKRLLGRE